MLVEINDWKQNVVQIRTIKTFLGAIERFDSNPDRKSPTTTIIHRITPYSKQTLHNVQVKRFNKSPESSPIEIKSFWGESISIGMNQPRLFDLNPNGKLFIDLENDEQKASRTKLEDRLRKPEVIERKQT